MSVSAVGRPPRLLRKFVPLAFVVVYAVVTLGIAHGGLYLQGLLLTAAIFATLALSLNLVATTGRYSLAQAGLFAVGAYLSAILSTTHGWNIFIVLPLSIVASAVCGLVLGLISLRVSGLYFSILTLIFTLIVGALLTILKITGGYSGLISPIFPDFPRWLSPLGTSLAWLIMAVLLLMIGLAEGVKRSPLYPILLAIRDSEPFAESVGVRTSVIKLGVFALSAALAGLAGWAYSFTGFIAPPDFTWTTSVDIMAMVVLGGLNTTVGPILGAAFISIFPAYVNLSPLFQQILFGALFVVVIILAPQGAVGVVTTTIRRWRGADKPGFVPRGEPEVHAETALSPAAIVNRTSDDFAIRCNDVVFRYGNRGLTVLDHVDFSARWGTIHGLIGPNGSGKSTLVDLISGRMRPVSGTIELDGVRVDGERSYRRPYRGLMRTFQSTRLVTELTTRTNVLMGLYSRFPRLAVKSVVWPYLPGSKKTMGAMTALAGSAMEFVGAGDWQLRRVSDVPHGINQLTQLAVVSSAQPRILILDEPLAGLSVGEVEQVRVILGQLKEAGLCVILIEHQPKFVFSLCDDVTVLSAGEVVASGPAAEIREHSRVREVYLGQ